MPRRPLPGLLHGSGQARPLPVSVRAERGAMATARSLQSPGRGGSARVAVVVVAAGSRRGRVDHLAPAAVEAQQPGVAAAVRVTLRVVQEAQAVACRIAPGRCVFAPRKTPCRHPTGDDEEGAAQQVPRRSVVEAAAVLEEVEEAPAGSMQRPSSKAIVRRMWLGRKHGDRKSGWVASVMRTPLRPPASPSWRRTGGHRPVTSAASRCRPCAGPPCRGPAR